MAIAFRCSCGREIRVKSSRAGQYSRCPGCGGPVVVPRPGEPPPAAEIFREPEEPVPAAAAETPDAEEPEGARRELGEGPCWLISFGVHCVLLFLLALITVAAYLPELKPPVVPSFVQQERPQPTTGPEEISVAPPEMVPIVERTQRELTTTVTREQVELAAPTYTSDQAPRLSETGGDEGGDGQPAMPGDPGVFGLAGMIGLGENGIGRGEDRGDGLPGPRGPFRHRTSNWERKGKLIQNVTGQDPTGGISAIILALEWLKRHQETDGRWDCADHDGIRLRHRNSNNGSEKLGRAVREDEHVRRGYDVAVTGLALLTYLGAGMTTADDDYGDTVRRAIYWLQAQQQRDGRWPGSHYAQGIAALAMAEADGMGCGHVDRGVVRKGLEYIIRAQNPDGGWNYHTGTEYRWDDGFVQAFPYGGRDRNDTSITGWMVMALKSGLIAGGGGVNPDELINCLNRAATHFRAAAPRMGETGGRGPGEIFYALEQRGNGLVREDSPRVNGDDGRRLDSDSAVAAITALSLQYMGRDAGDQFLLRLADKFQAQGPALANLYYVYYATLAQTNMGGDYSRDWNRRLADLLVPAQVTEGDDRGSWSPDSRWASAGGRVYSTTMAALSLEAVFRYLPIYGDQ